jgi:hypothetical protein
VSGYVRTDELHTVAGQHDGPTNAEDLAAGLRLLFRVKERSTAFDTEAAAAASALVADGRDVEGLMAAFGYVPA